MSVKSVVLGAALAFSVMAFGAQAATITFEGAVSDVPPFTTPGPYVFGPTDEAGFRYSVAEGALFINAYGNPGRDMEGYASLGGGVLKIEAVDTPLFTFDALQYAAYDYELSGSQSLLVQGFRNGVEVGSDLFGLTSTNVFEPGYDNWTLFGATGLYGLKLDTLLITLNGSLYPSGWERFQAVDNIILTGVSAVPEPATWAMMITGFGLAGAMLRRRREQGLAVA